LLVGPSQLAGEERESQKLARGGRSAVGDLEAVPPREKSQRAEQIVDLPGRKEREMMRRHQLHRQRAPYTRTGDRRSGTQIREWESEAIAWGQFQVVCRGRVRKVPVSTLDCSAVGPPWPWVCLCRQTSARLLRKQRAANAPRSRLCTPLLAPKPHNSR
jgi:hypothetical protein